MRHLLLISITLVITGLAVSYLISNCLRKTAFGSTSWLHYQSGGRLDARSPSPSPDGEFVVLTDSTRGNGDIAILSVKSDTMCPLVSSEHFETSPMFLDKNRVLFVRESFASRNIVALDRTSGLEQQITHGDVWCDILDVSNDGDTIIISYSDTSPRGDRMRTAKVVSTSGQMKEIAVGNYAQFTSDGRVAYSTFGDERTKVVDLPSGKQVFMADGVLQASSRFCPLLILARPWSFTSENNQRLWIVDIEAGTERLIGDGNAVAFISPGKCLGYRDYRQQPFVVDVRMNIKREIVGPSGVKESARPNCQGKDAWVWVHGPNGENEEIYRFDVESETFVLHLRLPRSGTK